MQYLRPAPPRGSIYLRRLSTKLLSAFDQACEQGDFEVAWMLLACLDRALSQSTIPVPKRRSLAEPLHAAHERLWCLRHAAEIEKQDWPLSLV